MCFLFDILCDLICVLGEYFDLFGVIDCCGFELCVCLTFGFAVVLLCSESSSLCCILWTCRHCVDAVGAWSRSDIEGSMLCDV